MLAVELEARLCDFDDEHGPRGMLAAVVSPASASDRDIRLGLRHIVQRDRPLRPYEPGRSEGSAEGVLDEADRLPGRKTPTSINRPYSARVQRRVRAGYVVMSEGYVERREASMSSVRYSFLDEV